MDSRLVGLLTFVVSCVYCATIITVPNGESDRRSVWTGMLRCPKGSVANGASIQNDHGYLQEIINRDETALNGIALHCNDESRTVVRFTGEEGVWGGEKYCFGNSHLVAFQMRVLPNKRAGTNSTQDDTAVNDIKFLCSNDQEVSFTTGNNGGEWGDWSENCTAGICGVEPRYGNFTWPLPPSDNNAVNDIRFECCE